MLNIALNLVKFLLIPFSLLYGIIIDIRNLLYDWGVFKAHKFSMPIISIGNLTMGGAGKTPFTIFLAGKMWERYNRIAVISRGYGRKSKGLQIVSDGKEVSNNPVTAGDEPCLIARNLPGIIVAVAENRREAIQFVIDHFQIDLIILDDGFQHRSVKRDLDILLVNVRESFKYNLPLPSGSLREFQHNRSRADIILLTNDDKQKNFPLLSKTIPQFSSKTEPGVLVDLEFNPGGTLAHLGVKKVCAFAGVAHPENFRNMLSNQGIKVLFFKAYHDHHFYTIQDMEMLSQICSEIGCNTIICTEKDIVKIADLDREEIPFSRHGQKIYAVSLNFIVKNEVDLLKKIQAHIDNYI